MKKYNAKDSNVISNSIDPDVSSTVLAAKDEIEYGAYVGLDVHKDTIAVAAAESGRGEPNIRRGNCQRAA